MVKSRFYEFVEGNEKYEVENVINENCFVPGQNYVSPKTMVSP